jgi:taurine dioxygenase
MIEFHKVTANIGAEVTGIDLTKPLDEEQVQIVRQGLLDNYVLFFRDQHIDDAQHEAFAMNFGTLDIPKMNIDGGAIHVLDQTAPKGEGGDQWHSDNTFMKRPPTGSLLRAVILPEVGGDTNWANMYMVYDSLAPWLQRLCDELYAEHDLTMSISKAIDKGHRFDLRDMQDKNPPQIHPVVRVHPETGRKALYVNVAHTVRFKDMTEEESAPLLRFLFAHQTRPEFTCRFRWQVGSLAFWDNRCAQHNPINDYHGYRRAMHRVTLAGDTPR